MNFINASNNAVSYQWNFGNLATPNLSANTNESVLFNVTHADTIPVTLIAMNASCADTAVKNIIIKEGFTVYAPSAFTPNADGHNDIFFIDGLNHLAPENNNFELLIFDRWGELVYTSTHPYQGWNGKKFNSMDDCEIDVYVWKISYTNTMNNKKGSKIGQVTLLR